MNRTDALLHATPHSRRPHDAAGRRLAGVRWIAVAATALAALIAVAALAKPRPMDASNAAQTAPTRGAYVPGTLGFGGEQRRYLLRLPAGDRAPDAIVVLLHGGGGNIERLTGQGRAAAPYRAWETIADREGLLLVAPQGLDGDKGRRTPAWNDCRSDADSGQTADDAGFLTALVERLQREHSVRTPRTYAVGTSNGGMMALRLAVEHPERFTAVAAIAATMPAGSECAAPTRSVPVLLMHGTEDRFVPWDGGRIAAQVGGRGEALSVAESIAIWTRLADVSPTPAVTALPDLNATDGTRAQREVHATRQGRPQVVLIRIEGGGHNEPSPTQRYSELIARLLGPQSGDLESADTVWRFFQAHSGRE
jgi:polyhydroxybutyrate depolymerase